MIKKIAFIGHRVQDMARAKRFYGELLGLEKTAEYVVDRVQFAKPISEFQLTQYTLGRMAAKLAAARAITYAAAAAFEGAMRDPNPRPSAGFAI